MSILRRCAALLALLPLAAPAPAAEPPGRETPPDVFTVYGGGTLRVPGGAGAFADQVVSFLPGDPAPLAEAADPTRLLGPPDGRAEADGAHFTLGCRGEVVVAFTDNELLDGPGADLVVLEVGDAREGVEVAVSRDGAQWRVAGQALGGLAALDLGQSRREAPEAWRFVRLRDLGQRCLGPLPGADIDAVAALGMPRPEPLAPTPPEELVQKPRRDPPAAAPAAVSEPAQPPAPERATLLEAVSPAVPVAARGARIAASVLFDFNRWELRPEGREALLALVRELPDGRRGHLVVGGHTDAKGTDAYNLELSRRRAEAVAGFFRGMNALPLDIRTESHGESRPVADNDSEEGRAKNRRVELALMPEE